MYLNGEQLVLQARGQRQAALFICSAGGDVVGALMNDGSVVAGMGTLVNFSGLSFDARKLAVRDGTAASPVTEWGPTVQISRTENLTLGHTNTGEINPGLANSNVVQNDTNAALAVASINTAGSQMQVAGIVTGARTVSGATGTDAVGVLAYGRAMTGAVGRGTGMYAAGIRDSTSGQASGIEARTTNNAVSDDVYDAVNVCRVCGIEISNSGKRSGAAMQIVGLGGAPGAEYLVGIGALPLSVKDATIRDDSSATVTVDVNGTHAYAVDTTDATLTAIANVASAQTATGATAGSSGAPPAQVAGYLLFAVNGTTVKVPYYNP